MREIIHEESFAAAVEALGGAQLIDLALDSVIPGLTSNPFGYKLHEHLFTSFRYAITRPINWPALSMPPLVVIFTIDEDGNVHLQHVEVWDP